MKVVFTIMLELAFIACAMRCLVFITEGRMWAALCCAFAAVVCALSADEVQA